MDEATDACLDAACLNLLKTLQDLHIKKQQLQTCISNGFFLMSKARYVMGVKRVSKLSYDSVMEASTLANVKLDDDGVPVFEVDHNCEITPKKNKITKDAELKNRSSSPQKPRDFSEKSGEIEGPDEDIISDLKTGVSEVSLSDDSNVKKPTDPLKWFGVLVPETLRQSQSHFRKASVISGEICTLQAKLKAHEKIIARSKISGLQAKSSV